MFWHLCGLKWIELVEVKDLKRDSRPLNSFICFDMSQNHLYFDSKLYSRSWFLSIKTGRIYVFTAKGAVLCFINYFWPTEPTVCGKLEPLLNWVISHNNAAVNLEKKIVTKKTPDDCQVSVGWLFTNIRLGELLFIGGRVGLEVRALTFHQCGPGSISALGVICGLSLLVLYSALRGFSPSTPIFPSSKSNIWFDLLNNNCKIVIWAILIWFPLEL